MARQPRQSTSASSAKAPGLYPAPFHHKGLGYFWVLNDRCDPDYLQPQLDAFAKAGNVAALCLHPRPGLLTPYGSTQWWEFIREMSTRIAKKGLDVWLYDEDPYPSGAASGRVFYEHPEYNARQIEKFEFDPTCMEPEFFTFPVGQLLWAGLVPANGGPSDKVVDLTDRVGTLRRYWETWERWDSRFFYPETPRYGTKRADTGKPEYGMITPKIPTGMKLVAFITRPIVYDWITWGGLPDSFNPKATQYFIDLTHENYKKYVGHMFGNEIKAIFTDEPKYYSRFAWTTGMQDIFKDRFGYDLLPRLHQLFNDTTDPQSILTRLNYRQLLGDLFIDGWVKPVSQWCGKNKLELVGHISPEDDLIEQANYVSNLQPTYKHFGMAGLDIIIPALGDKRHPILSIGSIAGASAQQQHMLKGCMSETGACSGDQPQFPKIGHMLKWQTMLGVTSIVMHCAYSSTRGPRAFEYPPNYGPNNKTAWPHMVKIHKELAQIQEYTWGARQIAPVAVLWPIRTYWIKNYDWQNEVEGHRKQFIDLISTLLDNQVGVHIIDEDVLQEAKANQGELSIGLARYNHILVPTATILQTGTIKALAKAAKADVKVSLTGLVPGRQFEADKVTEIDWSFAKVSPTESVVKTLPRIIDIQSDGTDIRCTAWEKAGVTTRILMNIQEKAATVKAEGKTIKLAAGEVKFLKG
jgi:hypothetical protein